MMTNRNQAMQAVETLLDYCSTFQQDNEHRESLIKNGKFPGTANDPIEARNQLANHYGQKNSFFVIETKAKQIKKALERVTYRSID